MKKALKAVTGFTLIEVMVVIIIIGILAAVAAPLYTSYVNKGIAEEGKAVAGAVAAAEKLYFAQHNVCLGPIVNGGQVNPPDPLGLNFTQNKYFTGYGVPSVGPTGACSFTVFTQPVQGFPNNYPLIQVTLTQNADGSQTIAVSGT